MITGNRVHLKVRPEVSTLDFANGVLLQGFRIPALSTRRTETELELQDGQTFAIAGLLNNSMNSTMQKIPGIGDIPILGLLFKSKAAQKDQTELVVMITPQILPRNSQGVTTTLPRQVEPYMAPLPQKKTFDAPPPAFGRPAATTDGSPAAAAAAVSALTPAGPVRINPAPVAGAPASPAAEAAPLPSKTLDAPSKPLDAKGRAKDEETQRRVSKLEKENHEKAARDQAIRDKEQLKRDQEKAKKDAEVAKEQAKKDAETARLAAIEAKRQAELDKKRQKAIDEAAAKAKEAEARYQALSKGQKEE